MEERQRGEANLGEEYPPTSSNYMDVSKNRGIRYPKMDGENNGKPYKNGWFGGTTIFGNAHITVGPENPWFASDEFPFWNLAFFFHRRSFRVPAIFCWSTKCQALARQRTAAEQKLEEAKGDSGMTWWSISNWNWTHDFQDSLVNSGRIVPNISTWKGLAHLTLVTLQMFRCWWTIH